MVVAAVEQAPVTQRVANASFGFYTQDEVKRLSVKHIHRAETFDMLHNAIVGGVFDPAMGPVGEERCATCYLLKRGCPGHFGHVQLAVPVFQPLVFDVIRKILVSQCWNCHHFLLSKEEVNQRVLELMLLDSGQYATAKETRANYKRKAQKLATEVYDLKAELMKDAANETGSTELEEEDCNTDFWVDYSSSGAQSVHITATREKWITKFLSSAKSPAKCQRCSMPSRRLRVEKQMGKIFLMPLSEKAKAGLRAQKRDFPSVLGTGLLDADSDKESSGDEDSETKKKKKSSTGISEEGRLVTALEAREHLKLLFEKEKSMVNIIFGDLKKDKDGKVSREASAERFFLSVIPVVPNRYRPAVLGEDGTYTLHPLNSHFLGIIQSNNDVSQLAKNVNNAPTHKDYIAKWYDLQKRVIALYDSPAGAVKAASTPGLKQIIEKKEGMFRTNIMGKRVNYAARTVISPDPYVATNEIGVPEFFAKVLTFPAPVTAFNYQELAKAVLNGPEVHPGANCVEDEFGNRTLLTSETQRIGQSKTLLTPSPNAPPGTCKKVYRHLRTGDYVLMNRQPTLHKPSIMSHRVKVMSKVERTWRMHYTNCSTYNADFDGDEMNVHFPQTFLGQSEAANIAFTDHQYVVPKSGTPLRGLIQDSVVTGALLTKRDIFFTRGEFQHLVYGALVNISNRVIDTPAPAIWKPTRLWTGKQVISTVLKHITHDQPGITLDASTKISSKLWGSKLDDIMREGVVCVRDCELLCGVLDKNQFGASSFGLVHCCYELYGAQIASLLLTTLSRVFILFGQSRGFTCGMDDLLMRPEAETKRKELLSSTNELGSKVASQFVEREHYEPTEVARLMETALVSERESDRLDLLMKKEISPIASSVISACIPSGQVKSFPDNNFSLMTVSGAKGSQVNFSQVSCLLGQQELEGKRVPRMISGRTLPSFTPYDPTARAGGFIMDRFLTGIRPQEYFFHCMAGREGLIDTAVKTSRSGYLQRCLIKHLENLRVHYDYTVRDADNSVVQFLYGEDSLDVMKTGFLNNPKFKFFAMNSKLLVERMNPMSVSNSFDNTRTSKVFKAWKRFDKFTKEEDPSKPTLDPVLLKYPPGQNLGAVSTKFHQALQKYIKDNPDNLINTPNKDGLTGEEFRTLMYVKYSRSLVDPGEAVGLLAGQSIGEPSTQMTLNTFHLAGRGEANVTLGIPRFREILMTGSKNIKTPVMELQLRNATDKKAAETFANMLMRVTLEDLVSFITVEESILQSSLKTRQYRIHITFKDEYKQIMEKYFVNRREFRKEKLLEFTKVVNKALKTQLRLKKEVVVTSSTKKTKDDVVIDDEKDVDSNKGGDEEEGAIAERRKRQRKELSYGDDEDEEDRKLKQDTDQASDDETDKKQKNADEEIDEKLEGEDTTIQIDSKGCSFNLLAPLESRKILMLSLVEKCMKNFVVKQIPGITRAMVIETDRKDGNGNKIYAIQTEGVNLRRMWEYEHIIKTEEIYCNDIWAILHTYGVEMARTAITKEVKAVFNVYDISVDWRHLGLIADFMTFRGDYKAMNKSGMSSAVSPFQKMSYESCGKYLSEAVLYGSRDSLSATSSRITVGAMVNSGTGGFDLRVPVVTENIAT